ncbi:MAG: phosphodiester glycosidase family protein [Oscillospiraceae bacterium]|nr:phosphodiester glycosidase family protein [Oscillospiraceae bacterium]
MKKHLWTIVYGLLLTAFTAYIALDTFVLSSAYQTGATEMNTAMFAPAETAVTPAPAPEATATPEPEVTPTPEPEDPVPLGWTEHSYRDENIRIELTERTEYNTHIYIADIRISSVEYLKAAFARDTYGKNVRGLTSDIAEAHNAILAVNCDYYGAQEKGFVLRNGVLYRKITNKKDVLCVWPDGRMTIEDSYARKADELAAEGAWQIFCFGPGLIEDGQVIVGTRDEVRVSAKSNPRTAIGMIEPGHYIFAVSDGRTDASEGLSLYELATVLQSLGVTVAYNLDGGGSSTMVFNGAVVNRPTSYGNIRERVVSDIVYIG